MGGVGNGAAEEDWHRDLNPGMAAIPGRTTPLWQSRLEPGSFGRGWDHTAWEKVMTAGLWGAPFCHVA